MEGVRRIARGALGQPGGAQARQCPLSNQGPDAAVPVRGPVRLQDGRTRASPGQSLDVDQGRLQRSLESSGTWPWLLRPPGVHLGDSLLPGPATGGILRTEPYECCFQHTYIRPQFAGGGASGSPAEFWNLFAKSRKGAC